jgi:hypothetical protein
MIGNCSPISPSTMLTSNVDPLDIGQASMVITDNSQSKNRETIIDIAPPLRYVSKIPLRIF